MLGASVGPLLCALVVCTQELAPTAGAELDRASILQALLGCGALTGSLDPVLHHVRHVPTQRRSLLTTGKNYCRSVPINVMLHTFATDFLQPSGATLARY